MPKNYTGINIQWPISADIVSGEKTVETRTYPLPDRYKDVEMILIETPGKKGKFKSRITAIIKFTNCINYKDKTEFYKDKSKHLVTEDSEWAWKDKKKYGWEVQIVKKFKEPIPFLQKKGIVYTKNITI